MNIKACGRSALIAVTGLFVCFALPAQVTAASGDSSGASSKSDNSTSGKSVRQSSRHWKRYAHRRNSGATSKSPEAKKAADKNIPDISPTTPTLIPPSVANANAQLTSTDASADSASALTAKASTMLLATADKPAEAQTPTEAAVVASDQLNDVDLALQQTPATQTSRWLPPGQRLPPFKPQVTTVRAGIRPR